MPKYPGATFWQPICYVKSTNGTNGTNGTNTGGLGVAELRRGRWEERATIAVPTTVRH